MKLNMIVVMTTWLPRLACSQPGMKAQTAPKAVAARMASGSGEDARQPGKARQASATPMPAIVGLALAADVEQAGMEGDRDGEAGEDEIRRVDRA